MAPGRHKPVIERVTEVYVAVFPCTVNENKMAEVILAGYQKDPARPHMSIVRATVETHVDAVPQLVALCDEIIEEQEEVDSFRLLKFDQDGIHILDPDVFRAFKQNASGIYWGRC